MNREKQVTCRCQSYPFPHRQGGGKCGTLREMVGRLYDAGYHIDGDDAAGWVEAYGDVDQAVNAWIEEAKEPHPASIYY